MSKNYLGQDVLRKKSTKQERKNTKNQGNPLYKQKIVENNVSKFSNNNKKDYKKVKAHLSKSNNSNNNILLSKEKEKKINNNKQPISLINLNANNSLNSINMTNRNKSNNTKNGLGKYASPNINEKKKYNMKSMSTNSSRNVKRFNSSSFRTNDSNNDISQENMTIKRYNSVKNLYKKYTKNYNINK